MMGAQRRRRCMLAERQGNIALLGNGGSAGLHDTTYDFNDPAISHGIAH
jgi:hypothetical protein